MRSRRLQSGRLQHRRGLAPLELVLSLPLLLMIMAMIIIVGTAGAWKVRTLANSRQAAARDLWPRSGGLDPNPPSWWPNSANMSSGAADPAPFTDDPFAQHAVVRGPVVGAQGGNGLRVNSDMLDVSRGLFAGHASIDRDLPLWQQLPYRNKYQRETQVFSGDQWQFAPMGLGDNGERRVDNLYPDYSLGAFGGYARTMAAREALVSFPGTPLGQKLLVLDRDPELQQDFHPRLSWDACSIDLQAAVVSLSGQIEQVPCSLASAFLNYYQSQPSSPQNDAYIQQLQQFLQQNCGN